MWFGRCYDDDERDIVQRAMANIVDDLYLEVSIDKRADEINLGSITPGSAVPPNQDSLW